MHLIPRNIERTAGIDFSNTKSKWVTFGWRLCEFNHSDRKFLQKLQKKRCFICRFYHNQDGVKYTIGMIRLFHFAITFILSGRLNTPNLTPLFNICPRNGVICPHLCNLWNEILALIPYSNVSKLPALCAVRSYSRCCNLWSYVTLRTRLWEDSTNHLI